MPSVVIPNLNGAHFLEPCLESLARQTLPPDEVIVVDNGSTDGSVELVRERFPQICVLTFEENRGFAAAMNAGIAKAGAELVAFLNNDAVARSGLARGARLRAWSGTPARPRRRRSSS